MPIRFRCAYCNQLMSIARRKAGSVVGCPTCGGQVIVPHEQPQPGPQAPPGVFDQPNFEQAFQQPGSAPARGTGSMPSVPQQPTHPGGYSPSVDVEPVPLPGHLDGSGGCLLSTGKMILLGIIILLLLALAFVAGLLIGRTSLG
jgi:hypothetical protein